MTDFGLIATLATSQQPRLDPNQAQNQPAIALSQVVPASVPLSEIAPSVVPERETKPEFSQQLVDREPKTEQKADQTSVAQKSFSVEDLSISAPKVLENVIAVNPEGSKSLSATIPEGSKNAIVTNPEVLESSITVLPAIPSQSPETNSDQSMAQVNSVSQLSDVQPINWAFQALQSLVERYGCISGYPNQTFRGNRALTRYEFAAGLNACLDQVIELITTSTADQVKKEDLITLQKLQEEFAAELTSLRGRVDTLETRTAELESNQFSTTTRLFGQAIFSVQGSNQVGADLFPRDGIQERTGKSEITFSNHVEISLATSFRGNDLLLTGLQTGNLRSSAPQLSTNMGRLAYESEQDNQLVVSDLSYRFPLSDRFGVVVGPAGVNAANTFRGINPLEGSGDGALSLLGQRNPILTIGSGTGGIGFDWQIARRVSLQGVYSAELPAFAGDKSQGGLFGGRYTAGAQLAIAPTDTIDIGINYLFSHSPDGFLGNGIGDAQLLSPFAPTSSEFNTHAVGATVAWRVNSKWTIGGWGGWTNSSAVNVSGSVKTTNWMVFSAFPDLFAPGNLGGILLGQPPKITSSTLPSGYNFPRFSTDGEPGGQPDTAFHLELFYRARLNPSIDLTPGVLVVFNPSHNAANDTLIIGALRATFRF
jgi:Carbohydrate-selective porin, OprB family/S-layer homology domain